MLVSTYFLPVLHEDSLFKFSAIISRSSSPSDSLLLLTVITSITSFKRKPLDPVILPVTPDVDPNLIDPLDLLGLNPWVMFPDFEPGLMDPLDLFAPILGSCLISHDCVNIL